MILKTTSNSQTSTKRNTSPGLGYCASLCAVTILLIAGCTETETAEEAAMRQGMEVSIELTKRWHSVLEPSDFRPTISAWVENDESFLAILDTTTTEQQEAILGLLLDITREQEVENINVQFYNGVDGDARKRNAENLVRSETLNAKN
ncbi:MAG: hypothetical protein AAGK09_07010 [Planctomycetota bacterium]